MHIEMVLAIVTIVHCMQFFGDLQEDVMLNYPRTDVLMTTARVALFFTLLCSYPVLLHPTRGAINRLVIYSYQLLTGGCRRREGREGGKVAQTKELEKHFEAEEEVRVKGEEKVPLLQQQKTKSSSDVEVCVCLSLFLATLSLSLSRFLCLFGSVRRGYSLLPPSSVPATSLMSACTHTHVRTHTQRFSFL